MNYYYPPDLNSPSKAVWVLDALSSTDKSKNIIRNYKIQPGTNVVWGLGNGNFDIVKSSTQYIFTDMPYWNRWMGNNRSECYWRIIPNALHCNWINDFPNDRFRKLNVKLNNERRNGKHILVCPSSPTLERFYDATGWTQRIVTELKKHTDRPIKIRHKPRGKGTSGPRAAEIPFEVDANEAWAVVTLASIAGVEAMCLGIPVFCHPASACAPVGNLDISKIEAPEFNRKETWLNTLSYYQYTQEELKGSMNVCILSKQ
jgi:hypothetical protein